jgi:hypothetical protein
MRRYLILLNLVWLLVFVGLVGTGWLVDPYRIFHKPWFGQGYYVSDGQMRDVVAGIVNTEEFDSVILGSSMAANFSAKEASQIFQRPFVNISMDGSGIMERSMVLDYALKRRKIAEVIFSFDWLSLDKQSIANTPLAPYLYLYDENRANDLQIYTTNFKAQRYALCQSSFFSSNRLCRDRKKSLEDLVGWHSNEDDKKRFGGLDNWLDAGNNSRIREALQAVTTSIDAVEAGQAKPVDRAALARVKSERQQVFENTIMRIAAEHPDTRFYLFFPPYSRLRYALLQQSSPEDFEAYLEVLRFVIATTSRYPNVMVFGFETESFLDDIANYKDTSHYHQRYNSAMLGWMKAGEHQLTPSNIDVYIQEIRQRATNYQLKEIGRKISNYLSKP